MWARQSLKCYLRRDGPCLIYRKRWQQHFNGLLSTVITQMKVHLWRCLANLSAHVQCIGVTVPSCILKQTFSLICPWENAYFSPSWKYFTKCNFLMIDSGWRQIILPFSNPFFFSNYSSMTFVKRWDVIMSGPLITSCSLRLIKGPLISGFLASVHQ